MMPLRIIFEKLVSNYTFDLKLPSALWMEIEKNYSGSGRYYHTLDHLSNMLLELQEIQQETEDWNTILFGLFYHDIIYKSTSNNNEEKSADIAVARLTEILVPKHQIERCETIILATKRHQPSTDSDINYFTDADLSILGQSKKDYLIYASNVRKEYSIYPDFIYKPGRKKVLDHFLEMQRIYKTDFFYKKFEMKARENLQDEMRNL